MDEDPPRLPTRRLERAGLDLTVLGVGGTGPGGLYRATDRAASGAMQAEALAAGIGYLDTAPFYDFGLSERIVGDALRGRGAVLSTKVGRPLRPGAHPDPSSLGWPGALPFTPVFDYGYDGGSCASSRTACSGWGASGWTCSTSTTSGR